MSRESRQVVIAVTNDFAHDRRMRRVADSLLSAGYTVIIIVRRLKSHYPVDKSFGGQIIRLRCFVNTGPLFYAEYNIRLFIAMFFLKADIYYAVDLDTLLPMALTSKLKKRSLIYDSHEYFTEVPELHGRRITKSIWTGIGRSFIKCADLRITIGHELSDVLTNKYEAPFKVVQNLPHLFIADNEQEGSMTSPYKLVYLGVLNEGRGLSQLVRAMADMPTMHLTILGDGVLRASLEKLVVDLHVADRVILKGMIPQEEVLKELTKHHIGINLLDARSLSYYYSLANKCFDYIQAELPAVHMDFPEYRRLIQDFGVGVLVEKLSVAHIVAAIQRLTDEIEYQLIKKKCGVAKLNMNWEKEEKRFLNMMSSCK